MAAATPSTLALTPQQISLSNIAARLHDVELSVQQQDQIIDIWLGAPKDSRIMIAQLYPKYFNEVAFVQRVHVRAAARASTPTAKGGGAGRGDVVNASGDARPKNLTQAARRLRNAIDDAVSKLKGAQGPHAMRFGVVSDAALNSIAIELYCSQFTYPEPSAMRDIVTVPRRTTTRTRRNPTGNFTWFLWCVSTNEMACCVTVTVHQCGTMRFVEMPLFATASGYKRHGLGRLLNAALQEYCVDCSANFILVSSDPGAVDFWCSPSMGYTPITNEQKRRVEFVYKTDCNQFEGSVLLTWTPPPPRTGGANLGFVYGALQKTPNVLIEGDTKLPLP